MHETLKKEGWNLPDVKRVMPDMPKEEFRGAVIIAPPSADGTPWIKRFTPYSIGVCSGWMQVRGNARRKNVDAGFVMSDHADWDGLLQVIKETEAQKVFVTHGFQAAFSRYLNEIGIESAEVKTQFGNDEEEAPANIEEGAAEEDVQMN
jgi:putative mRNA 3-end processing factor